MYLSNQACKQAMPADKPYKLTDGDGMYLLVQPNGTKCWRMDYSYAGRRKTAALGIYPEVSLQKAREKRQKMREHLIAGVDPGLVRREEKILQRVAQDANFQAIALEWYAKREHEWTPRYAKQVLSVLNRDFFPALGPMPIQQITPILLLATLQKIEDRGALDLLTDARSYAGQIFRFAIATGRAERDIAYDLRDAFKRHIPEHHPSLRADELPDFLKALEAYPAGMGRTALKLVLLTLVRTTELRAAEWAEFDLKKALWVIPAKRMKMRREHLVPLSRQALALLEALRAQTGNQPYLFPNRGRKHRIMHENTMLDVVEGLGYKKRTTVHGIRATGSTILHESGEFRSEVIERQLAHVDKNKVRGAYNHAHYLSERQKLVQWWADFLEKHGFAT